MRRGVLSGLVLLGLIAAQAGGCDSEEEGCAFSPPPGYPIETIQVNGNGVYDGKDASDVDVFFHGGPETRAWGGPAVLPHVANDPVNKATTTGVGWLNSGYNQEILAFDTDWSSRIKAPDKEVDGIPSDQFWFFSMLSKGTPNGFQHKFWSDRGLAHVLHYDHGACRLTLPWQPLVDIISQQANGLLWCNLQCNIITPSATLAFDHYQADFTTQDLEVRTGLAIEAQYDFTWGPFRDGATIRPLYEFSVEAETGLLDVTAVFERVISTDQNAKNRATIMLKDLPDRIIDATLVPAVSVPLSEDIFQCDPAAPVADQQSTCFKQLKDPAVPGGPPLLEVALTKIFVDGGENPVYAADDGQAAAQAVEPRNFACVQGASGGRCAFHPVIERILVLPDVLEFVLANTDDINKRSLYRAADILLKTAKDKNKLPPLYTQLVADAPLCNAPIKRMKDGPIPVFKHENVDIVGPPPSLNGGKAVCPPCPP